MINRDRIIEEFSELVAIDAPSFGERKMADVLKNKLKKVGFKVEEDEAGKLFGGDCGNLYGYLNGDIAGEPLLFSAHMDTVSPAYGKKAVIHPNGRITSSGNTVLGADDVSGIVSILEAIRSIREDGISHRSIEVMFAIAEEPYAKGSSEFNYSSIKSKEAYILDLSGKVGRAAYKAPSILSFEVTIKGKAGHAAYAQEDSIHSIAIAAQVIAELKLGKIDKDTTANIGTIVGGEATNIIPETCKLEGEVRSFVHHKAVSYLNEISTLFEKKTEKFGASMEWKEAANCLAYETDRKGKTAVRYKIACEKAGITAEFIKTFGGSDCNSFAQHNIDGLVLSNAMNNIHSCEEYTEIEEIIKSTQIVENLITSEL